MVEAQQLELNEMGGIYLEIQNQPAFRRTADEESDYYDGNQLDSATLQAMADLGMAPIVENGVAPAVDSVLGYEAKNRLDFIITPENDDKYADMAKALSQKINEAERRSRLDQACSDAFGSQAKVGIGWVGIGFEHDPFKYPHRAEYVHRNEIFWDMKAVEPDLSDARWLIRRKWYDLDQLLTVFPDKADLLKMSGNAWQNLDMQLLTDGGKSTDLAADFNRERAWTLMEQEWRDAYRRRMCLAEVWYRRWVRGYVLKSPDGRVVEYDEKNQNHQIAVQSGALQPFKANFTKTRLAWWIGPHQLADIPNPYRHGKFPYVPFFGKREDNTGIPYGLIRAMRPMQDEINARSTKSIWLLAAKRVTMTEGVADVNETRNEAARPDAVHVLNAQKMQQGGVFKVETDFDLNAQQYQSLQDKREALKNVAGIYRSFEGQNSNATSGKAIDSLVEQSSQTLATIFSNQRFARAAVGELLLSNIIQEIGDKQVDVSLKAEVGKEKTVVTLNARTDRGLDNDIQRAILHVSLSDVPTTNSYRQQQAAAFAEILKSLPPDIQVILMDFYLLSTDMEHKEEAAQRIRDKFGIGGDSPQSQQMQLQMQQMQQQMQQLAQALEAAQKQVADKSQEFQLKSRELDIKDKSVTLSNRVNAEKILTEREKAALQHANATRSMDQADESRAEEQQQGEMDDAQEIDAIVSQVEGKIAPRLDKILKLLDKMQQEDQAESGDKETPKETKAEKGQEEPAEM